MAFKAAISHVLGQLGEIHEYPIHIEYELIKVEITTIRVHPLRIP
jgi:hypothetical protein